MKMRKADNQKGYELSNNFKPTESHVSLPRYALFFRSEGNKAYPLKVGSVEVPIYCHMTDDLGACEGGGWTLVMKIDGNKV